ncbi:MAG: response regulator [Phycisphaerales bacterium]|nr:response regulator [Phycisphaerales bacterium]
MRSLLDQLDKHSEVAKSYSGREFDRFNYRVSELHVDIPEPTGDVRNYSVPSRNVSRNGCCFLVGRFVYPGTEITVHLVSVHNHAQAVRGVVRRCRYLTGSGSVHEIGVEFLHPIDVAMFDPRASTIRVLLVDSDPTAKSLVEHLLKSVNVDLVNVETPGEVDEVIKAVPFDLVLFDVDREREQAHKVMQSLRSSGFFRPIVGLSASAAEDLRAETLQAGATHFIQKPLSRDNLMTVVLTVKDEPLISTMVHDRDMAPLIDTFVQGLSRRTRELEQAFASQARDKLLAVVRGLKGDGGSYGFDVITNAATEVVDLLEQEAEFGEMREKLNDLVRFCSAARPASCEVEATRSQKK